jgi:hypothetical protein
MLVGISSHITNFNKQFDKLTTQLKAEALPLAMLRPSKRE